jgi:NADH-quinone oxidoreductase subunit M
MPTNALSWLIPLALAVPFVAAFVAALLGPQRGAAIRAVALLATVVTLILVATAAAAYPQARDAADVQRKAEQPAGRLSAAGGRTFAPVMAAEWELVPLQYAGDGGEARTTAIRFAVGVDGINVWLVVLTALLMVTAVLGSWTAITERVHEFYAWLLLLEVGMVGVFLAFDIVLFYVFFELTLVPLFFLIGIWGGPQRQYAARKFFIYTLAGSVITLLGLLGVVLACYYHSRAHELTFSIPRLIAIVQEQLATGAPESLAFWNAIQLYVFLALMAGFAIKVPLVPFHTWLPLAHVEAPTAGSVLLAGILLKIGAYGFLRLCVPLAPDTALALGVPLIATLAVIGIIYGAFCALGQDDIKKLVAYSSVSHLGLCMLGMFALNETGLAGSLIQMVNHGLSTGGLFLVVGMLYERYHTRKIDDYGGLAARLKLLSVAMVFLCLSSVGLPGLNGFWGEVLVLMGIARVQAASVNGWVLAALGATGLILGAWYLMTLLRRVFFGPVKEPHQEGHGPVADLNLRELCALVPIGIVCLLLGVYPQPFFRTAEKDLKVVAAIMDDARERAARAEQAASNDSDRALAGVPGEEMR